MADHHAIGVEHPGHDLCIGAGIGRGDVVDGADDGQDFGGISAGEAFFFAEREFFGVADDAAFGAAEGEIDQGIFPGLEHGQRHDFIAVDGGVEADAAFEGAACVVVLGAIAGEDLDVAIVHLDGAGDGEYTLGRREKFPPLRVEIHLRVDAVEILMGVLPEFGVGGFGFEEVGVFHGGIVICWRAFVIGWGGFWIFLPRRREEREGARSGWNRPHDFASEFLHEKIGGEAREELPVVMARTAVQ